MLINEDLLDNSFTGGDLKARVHLSAFRRQFWRFGRQLKKYEDDIRVDKDKNDVFEYSKEMEIEQRNAAITDLGIDLESYNNYDQVLRHMGIVTELVRTLLAEAAVSDVDSDSEAYWKPPVDEKTIITFDPSKDLRNLFEVSSFRKGNILTTLKARLLWECQNKLYHTASNLTENPGKYASTQALMVLGFPSLQTSDPEYEQDTIHITALHAPQMVKLIITLTEDYSGSRIAMHLESTGGNVFLWEKWRDSVVGRTSGHEDWRKARDLPYRLVPQPEGAITTVPRKVFFAGKFHWTWEGWLPLRIIHSKFEIQRSPKLYGDPEFQVKRVLDCGTNLEMTSAPKKQDYCTCNRKSLRFAHSELAHYLDTEKEKTSVNHSEFALVNLVEQAARGDKEAISRISDHLWKIHPGKRLWARSYLNCLEYLEWRLCPRVERARTKCDQVLHEGVEGIIRSINYTAAFVAHASGNWRGFSCETKVRKLLTGCMRTLGTQRRDCLCEIGLVYRKEWDNQLERDDFCGDFEHLGHRSMRFLLRANAKCRNLASVHQKWSDTKCQCVLAENYLWIYRQSWRWKPNGDSNHLTSAINLYNEAIRQED